MAKKEILDKLSIYIPRKSMKKRPVERLIKLSEKRGRSINYLVVDAILQYLDRAEKKEARVKGGKPPRGVPPAIRKRGGEKMS